MTIYEPRASNDCSLTTENDRTPIQDGDILYNYYDCEWGTVVFDQWTEETGWFTINGTSLNGVRVSTKDSQGRTWEEVSEGENP